MMSFFKKVSAEPIAYALKVPLVADPVDRPIVTYGHGPTSLHFTLDDSSWGRVTFEKLDAIRVCRGENHPYKTAKEDSGKYSWVSRVENSSWLQERYSYELTNYGSCYEFGGNVDEMLSDFSHFVFHFHDQFVEAICAGIWFEQSSHLSIGEKITQDHPFSDLSELDIAQRYQAHGITYQLRKASKPLERLCEDARLCSQKFMQVAAELDGSASVSLTVTLRQATDGTIRSYLKSRLGKVELEYKGVLTFDQVKPYVEAWLAEVAARRKK
jgi:hypothetical protein